MIERKGEKFEPIERTVFLRERLGRTFEEIGSELGCSKQYASRLYSMKWKIDSSVPKKLSKAQQSKIKRVVYPAIRNDIKESNMTLAEYMNAMFGCEKEKRKYKRIFTGMQEPKQTDILNISEKTGIDVERILIRDCGET